MHLNAEGKEIVFKAGIVQLTKSGGKEQGQGDSRDSETPRLVRDLIDQSTHHWAEDVVGLQSRASWHTVEVTAIYDSPRTICTTDGLVRPHACGGGTGCGREASLGLVFDVRDEGLAVIEVRVCIRANRTSCAATVQFI